MKRGNKRIEFNIDDYSSDSNRLKEKQPFAKRYILVLVLSLALWLVFFLFADCFSVNQITFLGIAGASLISFVVLLVSGEKEVMPL